MSLAKQRSHMEMDGNYTTRIDVLLPLEEFLSLIKSFDARVSIVFLLAKYIF